MHKTITKTFSYPQKDVEEVSSTTVGHIGELIPNDSRQVLGDQEEWKHRDQATGLPYRPFHCELTHCVPQSNARSAQTLERTSIKYKLGLKTSQ